MQNFNPAVSTGCSRGDGHKYYLRHGYAQLDFQRICGDRLSSGTKQYVETMCTPAVPLACPQPGAAEGSRGQRSGRAGKAGQARHAASSWGLGPCFQAGEAVAELGNAVSNRSDGQPWTAGRRSESV